MRKRLERICEEIGVNLRDMLIGYAMAGVTLTEAAWQLGTNASVVWRWARAYGIDWPTWAGLCAT
jgi:hypothetical protein